MSRPSDLIESDIKPFAEDWEDPKPGEEHYSTNQLIAAYKAGYAKGVAGAHALLQETFNRNYQKSGEDTGKVIEKLQEFGLNPLSALLRVVSWEEFEVLITLPEAEFLDEKLESAYDFVGEFENSARTNHYCLSFRFCPTVDGLDEQKMKSDGFTIAHRLLVK